MTYDLQIQNSKEVTGRSRETDRGPQARIHVRGEDSWQGGQLWRWWKVLPLGCQLKSWLGKDFSVKTWPVTNPCFLSHLLVRCALCPDQFSSSKGRILLGFGKPGKSPSCGSHTLSHSRLVYSCQGKQCHPPKTFPWEDSTDCSLILGLSKEKSPGENSLDEDTFERTEDSAQQTGLARVLVIMANCRKTHP